MANPTRVLAVIPVVFCLEIPSAVAEPASSRPAIAEMLTKLSSSAAALAKRAKASDDRGARKKFGPAAEELSDDLASLARRVNKDVPMKSLAKDAEAAEKQATALVDLADEAEDKDERKALRSQAVLIQERVAAARKLIAAHKDGEGDGARAPQRHTGTLLNNSNSCSWEENLRFVVSRDGQRVLVTPMVFPGKSHAAVLEKGTYLVQLLDTSGQPLGQGTLDANKEGWLFKCGCVNQK